MIWCFTINSTALNDTLLVWESDWDNDENNNNNKENNNNEIALMDINSNEGKEFQRLFRVLFSEFVFISKGFLSQNKMKDTSGRPAVDCRLLVLSLLWFLAWGAPFKQLEELS